MPKPKMVTAIATEDWEVRHKQAATYQIQLNALQQASLAGQAAWASLIFTAGLAMSRAPDVPPKDVSLLIFICVGAWIVVAALIHNSYCKRADRVRKEYLSEQKALFPTAHPCRLESYLIDNRKDPEVRWVQPPSPHAITMDNQD